MYRKWKHSGPLYRATYYSWHSMVSRCTKKKDSNFPLYGGRGIEVCKRWRKSFDAFVSDMGIRPAGTTLDRENNNGHYEPGNCRWATPVEQGKNRRTNRVIVFRGRSQQISEWAAELGVTRGYFRSYVERYGAPTAIEKFLSRMEI